MCLSLNGRERCSSSLLQTLAAAFLTFFGIKLQKIYFSCCSYQCFRAEGLLGVALACRAQFDTVWTIFTVMLNNFVSGVKFPVLEFLIIMFQWVNACSPSFWLTVRSKMFLHTGPNGLSRICSQQNHINPYCIPGSPGSSKILPPYIWFLFQLDVQYSR